MRADTKVGLEDLFGCPGCMRKLRGSWRYCERCEARRLVQGSPTVDGHFQLALLPELKKAKPKAKKRSKT